MRAFIALLVCIVLTACGGTAEKTISLYGDSYSAQPGTIERICSKISNAKCTNYSKGGMTTTAALTGTFEYGMPFPSFQAQMEDLDHSEYIVLRYGIAESFWYTPEVFQRNMETMLELAIANNKKPILVRILQLPATEQLKDKIGVMAAMNNVMMALGDKYSIPVIDLEVGILVGNMYEDGVHLKPEVTEVIDGILGEKLEALLRKN